MLLCFTKQIMKKLFVVAYILFVLMLSAKARAISLELNLEFSMLLNHPVQAQCTNEVKDPLPSFIYLVDLNQMSFESKTENFVS